MEQEKYPIDISSFETLRNNQCVYVDKTQYIYEMVISGSHTFFLNRPKGFGKTLFLSTLKAYFSGQKELFKGLSIYDLEKEWESYPIIQLDFKDIDLKSATQLENYLRNYLMKIAISYDVRAKFDVGIGRAFACLIRDIAKKTAKEVVILIDEYDKGIIDVLGRKKHLETNYKILKLFYSAIKSQNRIIRYAFITGITDFRLYDNLTGGLNCFYDMSMVYRYASICGMTKEETVKYFPQGIHRLSENSNMSPEEIVNQLETRYGGYRFSHKPYDVINPFDLLHAFRKGKMENFWINDCHPMVFARSFLKQNFELSSLSKLLFRSEHLGDTFSEDNLIPLLYQAGYLTIKEYDSGCYRIGIPNEEVQEAFSKTL